MLSDHTGPRPTPPPTADSALTELPFYRADDFFHVTVLTGPQLNALEQDRHVTRGTAVVGTVFKRQELVVKRHRVPANGAPRHLDRVDVDAWMWLNAR